MDNKIVFGVITILFNHIGVPCFLQGNVKAGILRIVFGVITFGVIAIINAIMGIITGIKVLTMSDEEYAAQKGNIWAGIPSGAPKADAE